MTKKSRTAVGSSATGNTPQASANVDDMADTLTPTKCKLERLFVVDGALWDELKGMDREERLSWARKMKAWAWQTEAYQSLADKNEPSLAGLTRQMLEQN